MLGGDAREDWNGATMPDARVLHFWDRELHVGRWFAKNLDGYNGIAWEIYYLFGPDAIWEATPSPVVGSGVTIIGERQQLQRQISTLLE